MHKLNRQNLYRFTGLSNRPQPYRLKAGWALLWLAGWLAGWSGIFCSRVVFNAEAKAESGNALDNSGLSLSMAKLENTRKKNKDGEVGQKGLDQVAYDKGGIVSENRCLPSDIFVQPILHQETFHAVLSNQAFSSHKYHLWLQKSMCQPCPITVHERAEAQLQLGRFMPHLYPSTPKHSSEWSFAVPVWKRATLCSLAWARFLCAPQVYAHLRSMPCR